MRRMSCSPAQRMNHRTGTEEEQRFEECVREQMEDRHPIRAHAERQEHVTQLAHGRVRQHALDIVLDQRDGRRENRRKRADKRDDIRASAE